ncbi:sulfite exporter TauE/SafE family protein [Spirillospora sp. NPDC048911]|uniref:urease accessory protein UreH domain-containing protein n=1 Tax=Spirillospora sp. NPDC048911 TaxID=3364527 RepID=UPI003712AD48
MDTAALFLAGAGTGLLAGATTCAALQLGLLAGAVRDAPSPARPVGAFLAAKLVSHAVLGAALGLLGGAVQPGPRVRGALLACAALLLTLFALDLLGFAPAGRLLRRRRGGAPVAEDGEAGDGHCAVPVRAARFRRPVLLGAATVLVPCGLTLTAELLAVSSRSAVGGAAVMTGFVLGTAPVFGLVGLTVGRALDLLRGRLTALLGVALLAVAGWTMISGLRLGGWLPQTGADAASAADSARSVHTDATGTQIVTVWALDQGYRPARLTARAGVRTTLVVRTQNTHGHTRAFTLPARDLDVVLPVNGETRIDLGTPRPGRMRFVCASGHYPGAITFE